MVWEATAYPLFQLLEPLYLSLYLCKVRLPVLLHL